MGTQPAWQHLAAHLSQIGADALISPTKSPGVARDSCVLACSVGIVVQPCRMHSSYAFCGRIFQMVSSYTCQSS